MRYVRPFICVIVMFLPAVVSAQTVTATLAGVVLDQDQAVVPAAPVTATDRETGVIYQTLSSGTGVFRLAGLRPGKYDVEIRFPGLKTYRIEELDLAVGEEIYRTVDLEVAAAEESVTVVDDPAEVERIGSNGTRGGSFASNEVGALPMFGGSASRSFRVFSYQLPGVGFSSTAHAPFAVNGTRPIGTMNMTVDSAEYNDVIAGNLLGRGVTEQPVSMETVESMEVQTGTFKAEQGRASGLVVSLVTKHGTNDWHGSLYHYFQNGSLNARNALLTEKPPLKVNQPGFTFGGPLLRNKLFFYGGFEVFARDTFASSSVVQTLSDDQRARAVPSVRPLLGIYPRPNIPGTNFESASISKPSTSRYALGRFDYVLNERHQVTFRGNAANNTSDFIERLDAGHAASSNASQSYVLNLQSTLGQRSTNQLRASYTYWTTSVVPFHPSLGDPSVNGQIGLLIVTGLPLAGQFRPPLQYKQHTYTYADDWSYVLNNHILKAGGAVRRLAPNTRQDTNFNGTLVFTSVDSFLAGQPLTYSRSIGQSRLDLRGHEIAGYVQDDWKITRNFTLNLGLRYDYFSVPSDKYGRLGDLYETDKNNVAPRVGFAYNVRGRNSLIVRGGAGIYYTAILMDFIGKARYAPPLVSTYSRLRPVFPDLLAGAATQSNRTIIDRSLVNPYTESWNLALEKTLFDPDTIVSAAYVGSRGLHLARARRPNGGENFVGPRPNPSQAVIDYLEGSASSNYHSLQLTGRRMMKNGGSIRAAYTFGKMIDEVSNSTAYPIDSGNLRRDRGLSEFNQKHILTGSVVYPLPLFNGRRGLGGWQVAGTFTARSGQAYSILSNTNNPTGTLNNRINNIAGTLNRSSSGTQRMALASGITPAMLKPADGQIGALGRNTEVGPDFRDLSISLQKRTALTERVTLDFRIEGYNITNRVNYDLPVNVIDTATFGRILTAQDARQFQIAAKILF
jgi:outer membrane receptor protein involved in Fe transport